MNSSDFYDLFGPTKRSRKGNSLKLSFGKQISHEKPINLDLSLSGYWGLERLPNYQNIDATFDRFYNGSISLSDSKMALIMEPIFCHSAALASNRGPCTRAGAGDHPDR